MSELLQYTLWLGTCCYVGQPLTSGRDNTSMQSNFDVRSSFVSCRSEH